MRRELDIPRSRLAPLLPKTAAAANPVGCITDQLNPWSHYGFADEDLAVAGIELAAEWRCRDDPTGIAATVANLSAGPNDGIKNPSPAKTGTPAYFGF